MKTEVLFKQFERETGKEHLDPTDYGGYTYSDDYVEWLEQKLSQLTSSIKIEWRDDVGFENIQNS